MFPNIFLDVDFTCFRAVFRIRIHRIHVFLGLPGPDPLVRGMDPELLYYPKQNIGGDGGLRHLPPRPFTGQFLRKGRHLGFGVFIDIWSMQ
jgi:hypothetical protein